jgi:hypothetical protein
VVSPNDKVDFGRLPPVDTSAWKRVSGPAGILSVLVPPDWVVSTSGQRNAAGKLVGDGISVYKHRAGETDVGSSTPGWAKVDLSTSDAPVTVSTEGEVPTQEVQLQSRSNGLVSALIARQYGQSARFPNNPGQIVFLPSSPSSSGGQYLSAVGWAWLPGTVGDIAVIRAIIESAVLK